MAAREPFFNLLYAAFVPCILCSITESQVLMLSSSLDISIPAVAFLKKNTEVIKVTTVYELKPIFSKLKIDNTLP